MILVISKSNNEVTTEQVIDWLDALGAPWYRVNGDDLLNEKPYSFQIDDDNLKVKLFSSQEKIQLKDVRVIWNRRGGDFKGISLPSNQLLEKNVNKYLNAEFRSLERAFQSFFPRAKVLDPLSSIYLNKIDVLCKAREVGLNIPRSLITNSKQEALKHFSSFDNLITKAIYESNNFIVNNKNYILLTLQTHMLESIPDYFTPSLLQQKVDKVYEVRVFYLDSICYSMAIFSQQDKQTEIDYRNYNDEKPNRVVPYKLDSNTESKITLLMKSLNLSTGSVDFIKSKTGELVFLEVNPVGQFNMVSQPCNYRLEKKVANFLINEANDERA